ncbi:MAG: hypothetical protein ACE5MI_13370, partial [Acidimicrobiia bacterium]
MLSWFVAVLLLIDLGPAFQNASAFGEPAPNDMLFVDVQVEIAGQVQAAFAHVIDPGDEQLTVALINRGGSFWGGGAEIERANLVVVFEAIRPD